MSREHKGRPCAVRHWETDGFPTEGYHFHGFGNVTHGQIHGAPPANDTSGLFTCAIVETPSGAIICLPPGFVVFSDQEPLAAVAQAPPRP